MAGDMISVADARLRIVQAVPTLPAEIVPLTQAAGRVLAEDIAARRTQPPTAVSAMDGYAVRASDLDSLPAQFSVVGEAPAGGMFPGTVGKAEAVRIFTGGPVPDGADTVVIQENTDMGFPQVTILEPTPKGQNIRNAGIDFSENDVLLHAGRQLTPRDIGLAAAMNHPWISVYRRPRVALLATGDEVVRPGDPIGPNQIVSSNGPALSALIARLEGIAIDLGIARDEESSIRKLADGARGADLLLTMGGVSVGDRDLVRSVLGDAGLSVDFWKIAMKPGKPLMFGHLGSTPVIGLPGNPVSSLVCATLFVGPALRRMQGLAGAAPPTCRATLTAPLKANNFREDYIRATLVPDEDSLLATPFPVQDSSMMRVLAAADGLIIRPPDAPAAKAGDRVEVIRFE